MFNNILKDDSDQRYLVWDVESCCLNLVKDNDIWQLGFLLCQGNKILEQHNYYIKWEPLNISAGAALVTKFDRKKYEANWRDPLEILNLFEKYLYDERYKSLFHNGLNFDIYLHNQWRLKLGKPTDYSYLSRCIDTDRLARAIKSDIKYDGKNDFLAFQYRTGSIIKKGLKTSLSTLARELNIPCDLATLHDGLNDCLLDFEIWNKWIKNKVNI